MPSLNYRNREATLFFVPAAAAQAETKAFELHNLASGAGVQSAFHDLGEAAISRWYEWRAFVQFITTPVLGEEVEFWLKTMGNSAGAEGHPDNDDGTGASAVSSVDKLNNLKPLGSIRVDEAAINIEMVASGFVKIHARAIQIVAWNRSADGLTNDVDENGFWLSPVPDEGQ